jgi:PAS domain S-box-containing protein
MFILTNGRNPVAAAKQTGKALVQTLPQIDCVLNSVADTYILFDLNWRYLYVNKAAKRAIGRSCERIVGHTLWELYPDIVGSELEYQYRRAMTERVPVVFEFHYGTLDTWWENRFYPVPEGLSVFASNITERKRAEERLRQSEECFQQLAECIPEVLWMIDPDSHQLLYVSPAYQKIWGWPCEGLYKRPTSWMEAIHPDDRAQVEQSKNQQVLGRYDEEFRIIRPDGSVRWVRNRAFPVYDTSGKVYRITGMAEDITERKFAGETLNATHEQLRALSARLQAAREEEGTRIARELHDELGGALTCLKWDLEGFDRVISELTDLSQLEVLREKIQTMLRLTASTITTITQISSELRPTVLDDLGLVAAIGWQARQFQARSGIDCGLECLVDIDLNREQSTTIFRIFQEALTNILRHAQATSVNVLMKAQAGQFVLTVSDNGRGITEYEKSRSQSLGLLGMRERAHLIGADISFTGVQGCGTQVMLRVPIA